MKIITVNLPILYLKQIDTMVGDTGLYPSRSELIRVAVREFLVQELMTPPGGSFFPPPIATAEPVPSKLPPGDELDPTQYVQIPLKNSVDGVPAYKTYRLVKREDKYPAPTPINLIKN